jgi:hypothetical protein
MRPDEAGADATFSVMGPGKSRTALVDGADQ